jgi:hypothetical protein
MQFYTNKLGFCLDWTHEEQGRPYVVQVSLLGMEIILNQTAALLHLVRSNGISATYTHWGAPALVISDVDENELFFWLSDAERAKWQAAHLGAT